MHSGQGLAPRSGEGVVDDRLPAAVVIDDPPQPVHQSVEEALFGVLVAVSDADAAAMRADLGGDEQEPEPGQRAYLNRMLRLETEPALANATFCALPA